MPSGLLKDEFVRCGIPENKLIASGMPVRKAFYQASDKAQAKKALGIAPSQMHLLMMCGSMGCGPMEEITEVLRGKMGANDVLSVACSKNETLLKKLTKLSADCPNIRILGQINDVPRLMRGTDLFLTKPGGLSTSEAVAAGLPMVLIDAVAGCEEHNLDYFLRAGMAVTTDTPEEIASLALSLAHDEARLSSMRNAMQESTARPAAEAIYAWLQAHR